jgi:hypothetical protein
MEPIAYNISPLSVVMEQLTAQLSPINVIYIRVLQGHCSIYSMGAGKYLLRIYTWFLLNSRNLYPPPPLNPSRTEFKMQRGKKVSCLSKMQLKYFNDYASVPW